MPNPVTTNPNNLHYLYQGNIFNDAGAPIGSIDKPAQQIMILEGYHCAPDMGTSGHVGPATTEAITSASRMVMPSGSRTPC